MIREADESDRAAVARVFAQAWRSGFAGLIPDEAVEKDVDAVAKAWAGEFERHTVLVAERDEIVGFVWLREYDEDVEVHALYTLPGAHAGMALLNEAIERFEPYYPSIYLWSLDTNEPANAFYASRGFVPDGTIREVELAGAKLPHSRLRRPLTLRSNVRRRLAARVIARDPDGRILLMEHCNPRLDAPSIWLLPGGMPEGEESMEEAARREFFEETGHKLTEPIQRVWKRRHMWSDAGEPVEAVEEFFRAEVDAFEPNSGGFTESERQVVTQYRWFSPGELRNTSELIVPQALRYPALVEVDEVVWVGR